MWPFYMVENVESKNFVPDNEFVSACLNKITIIIIGKEKMKRIKIQMQ